MCYSEVQDEDRRKIQISRLTAVSYKHVFLCMVSLPSWILPPALLYEGGTSNYSPRLEYIQYCWKLHKSNAASIKRSSISGTDDTETLNEQSNKRSRNVVRIHQQAAYLAGFIRNCNSPKITSLLKRKFIFLHITIPT